MTSSIRKGPHGRHGGKRIRLHRAPDAKVLLWPRNALLLGRPVPPGRTGRYRGANLLHHATRVSIPLGLLREGKMHVLLFDQIGTVTEAFDETGALTWAANSTASASFARNPARSRNPFGHLASITTARRGCTTTGSAIIRRCSAVTFPLIRLVISTRRTLLVQLQSAFLGRLRRTRVAQRRRFDARLALRLDEGAEEGFRQQDGGAKQAHQQNGPADVDAAKAIRGPAAPPQTNGEMTA